MRRKFLFIIFFGICVSISAQKEFSILEKSQLKFEHFTSEDGLMHNSIVTILQDSKGYMWIGTNNGLYKYNGYEFKFYSSSPDDDHSLINKNVKTLYEDSNKTLWIGTTDGICNYNRKNDSFDRYVFSDSNNANRISEPVNCIYEDKSGSLWVGTRVGLYKLSKEENGKYSTQLFNYNGSDTGLSNNNIFVIEEDAKDNLWIGTNNGLNLLEETSDGGITFKNYHTNVSSNNAGENAITDILIDNYDNLWLGTKYGLKKMFIDEAIEEVSFKVYLSDKSNANSLSDNRISRLVQDHQGNIWVGTKQGGLNKFDPKTEIFKHHKQSRSVRESLNSNEISDIYEDVSGVLWVGTQRGGLSKLNLENKKVAHYRYNYFDPNGLSGNLINTIYEDSKKNLWVGTFGNGLNRLIYDKGNPRFIHYKANKNSKNSLSSNSIFGICEDNYGNYWVGTQLNGLNHVRISDNLDSNEMEVVHYSGEGGTDNFPTNKLATLYKDRLGDIWIGTFGTKGLLHFTPNEFGKEAPKFNQYLYDASNNNTISSSAISCIYEDREGVLWVGTNGAGLNRILRDEFNKPVKFIRIVNAPNNPKSLSDNSVFSVHEDTEGNIWVGTFGGGLNMIAKNQKDKLVPEMIRFNKNDGLSSNEVYGILGDDSGNLWVSTNNGISSYNPKENKFTNLHLSNGLQDVNFRKFAYHKGTNGLMYFGGIKGLNVFYPDGFEDNNYLPKMEIVDLKIFGKSVKAGEDILGKTILENSIEETDKIVLKNAHNSFSFEFAGLHYASPNQNKYAYMLEGFDSDWIYTDYNRRFATYSNLKADTYNFKVKVSNNDNIWNEVYKEIEIEVLPPIWKSWWAYLLYGCVIVLIMWLFKRYILINTTYQNNLKIEKIEQEKIKEVNKMKLEFFTNVSHEFKTPLTLILGPLQGLISSKETSSIVRDSLLLMERNANHLFRLVNQIMEFRKVENKELKLQRSKGDLVDFCREEVFSFKVLADKKEMNLAFECGEYSIDGFFDWDKMEKILNNLISNSIKYTGEGGTIRLSLSIPINQNQQQSLNEDEGRFVRIVVEDTGEGIPQNQLGLIFERFYQIKKTGGIPAQGSGIGLALTKSLVEMHKGTITVESVEKKGTKFIVELPLLTNLKSSAQPAARLNKKEEETGEDENEDILISHVVLNEDKKNGFEGVEEKPTILLVEDNLDMLEFISKSLEKDYEIHKTVDGVKGLEAALKLVPDLIISDVMMPNMDGIAFCKRIKEHEITSHIPVILLTAKGSTDHRIEGLEVGADSYIPKPFDMRHLQVRIKKLLLQRETLKVKFTSGEIKLDSQKVGINKLEKDFLKKMELIIDKNITNSEFGVEDLGEELGYSRMQLYRKLKTIRGLSANEFIREYRIKKAAVYLRETDMKIFEILYEVGISNHSYFTKCFKQYFNKSPREYIEENRGK